MSSLDVFDIFSRDYARERFETMSLRDWLLAARDDKMLYATPSERMVAAIGEPELVDTAQDTRLARLFSNRTIKTYRAFEGFYGMEDTIERIVGYFKHAAQGLEEKRQILYLLGPVGGGKSSLAERLKDMMEKHAIYVLKAGDAISPVFESAARTFPFRRARQPAGRTLWHRPASRRRADEPVGGEAAGTNSAATSRNSRW